MVWVNTLAHIETILNCLFFQFKGITQYCTRMICVAVLIGRSELLSGTKCCNNTGGKERLSHHQPLNRDGIVMGFDGY